RLPNRREWRVRATRLFDVIETHDGEIFRHPDASCGRFFDGAERHVVAGRDGGVDLHAPVVEELAGGEDGGCPLKGAGDAEAPRGGPRAPPAKQTSPTPRSLAASTAPRRTTF